MIKKHITNLSVLNEAYHYEKPSAFSRGIRVDMNGVTFIFISGTASIDEKGKTVHVGDFEKQTLRTYDNIKKLLEEEGATWKDVVKTTVYIKDISKHYEE
ncbi:MAG: Rid family hydrolase, partial [Bacteroidota bacterium]